MSSFGLLKSMIEELKQYGLEERVASNLLKITNETHYYFRNFFKFKIQRNAFSSHHCLNCGLSDPDDEAFASECIYGHQEECFHCESAETLVNGMAAVIDALKDKADQERLQEMNHDLKEAFHSIIAFKHHHLRNMAQSSHWENLQVGATGDTVFVTCDFAMKYVPQKNRESTKNW